MRNIVARQVQVESTGKHREITNTATWNAKNKARNEPKNVPVSAYFKKVVSIDELPVVINLQTGLLSTNARVTSGYFTLTYYPSGSKKYVAGKPYVFGQDFIRGRFCVSGPRHFGALCDRIPEFRWIQKWSFFDDGLFAVAKKHPGVAFGFNVNWVAYANMIEKKAEEMGLDIDHKPYLVYITTAEKMKQLREKYKVLPPPTKDDYKEILDDIDSNIKEERAHE